MINWQGVSLSPPWETSHPGALGKRTAGNFWKPPAFLCVSVALFKFCARLSPLSPGPPQPDDMLWCESSFEEFWRDLWRPVKVPRHQKKTTTTTKKAKLNPLTIMTGRPADTPSAFSPPGCAVFSDRWPLGVSKLPNTGCGDRRS